MESGIDSPTWSPVPWKPALAKDAGFHEYPTWVETLLTGSIPPGALRLFGFTECDKLADGLHLRAWETCRGVHV